MPGIVIDIDPVAVRLGGLAVRWYGVAVVSAILTGLFVGLREARRRGLDEDRLYTVALLAVAGAVVGARLFHVLDYASYYAAHPWAVLAFREGGLSIYGALVGGVVVAWLYARWAKIPFLSLADAVAPGLILAQAVGRLGCVVNGDSQGAAAAIPWAFIYTHPDALAPELGVPGHPYPLYEIIWNLLAFAVLWRLRGRVQAPGVLFLIYACLYSFGRFVLTFARTETEIAFGLQQAQVIALVLLVVALPAMGYLVRRSKALAAPRGEQTAQVGG